jgi:Na+-transporting methylmalonyl-CoA/oxaloacetate decarboxylase gamma subunit
MTITELILVFSNPVQIKTLNIFEKHIAVGVTIVLGMGITLVALIIILYLIKLMALILKDKNVANIVTEQVIVKEEVTNENLIEIINEEEVIAAITASLMMVMNEKNKFIVTNVKKRIDNSSSWGKIGLTEQLLNRF